MLPTEIPNNLRTNPKNLLIQGVSIGELCVFSVYVHPSTSLRERKKFVHDLKTYTEDIPKFLLCGDLNDDWKLFSDFNTRFTSAWESFIDMEGVVCLNDGSITRPISRKALDVSFSKYCDIAEWKALP